MPLALLVAPTDPRAGDAASRREALAWLRAQLARYKLDIVIVGAGKNPLEAIEKAAPTITAGDSVLVHVSGHLEDRDTLALGYGQSAPLRMLTEVFAARAPADLSFILELTYDDSPSEPQVPHAVLAAAVQSLGAGERGYPVLAAVRRASAGARRIEFTRSSLGFPDPDLLPPPAERVLEAMHRRAMAAPESRAGADAFLLFRGGAGADPDVLEIARATDAGDWARVAELRLDRVERLDSPREKSRELIAIARILQAELGDGEAALAALEQARELEPTRSSTLRALRRGYESVGRWASAAEVLGALAGLAESPSDRASYRVAQARVMLDRVHDDAAAMELLRSALDEDPTHGEALGLLSQLRSAQAPDGPAPASPPEFGHPAPVMPPPPSSAKAAPVMPPPPSSPQAPPVMPPPPPSSAKAAPVMPPPPPSSPKAAPVLPPPPSSANAGPVLPPPPSSPKAPPVMPPPPPSSPRGAAVPPPPKPVPAPFPPTTGIADLGQLEDAIRAAPLDPAPYAAAFDLHRRAGNTDAALLAAMALEELDASEVEQQILVDQYRTVGPVRARAPLDAAGWMLLRAPGFDDALAALFGAIEAAAIAAKLDELRDSRKLPPLDRTQRISETSTASVARSFQWAARVLGVSCPDLYAMEDAPGAAVVHAPHPSTALGRTVLSGRTAKDLAFLAGRHLTYYRPEHHVLLYYPSREALTELVFAAVHVVTGAGGQGAPALRARLAAHLGDRARAALTQAVRVLDARGGQAQIGAWMRGVELTAARVGLFLSGDLATAAGLVKAEARADAELSVEQRRGDLVSFCASVAHATVRARFVSLAPGDSVAPPSSTGIQRKLAVS